MQEMGMDFEKKLTEIEEFLKKGKERQTTIKSGMDIAEPREFLLWWTDKGQAEAIENRH